MAWGPATIWAAALFLLSAQEFPARPPFDINDKVAHFAVYAVLGAALAFGRTRVSRPPAHALLLAVGLLYGVSDEFHQSFVPTRTPSLGDLAANAVGLTVGYAGLLAVSRRRAPRKP